MGFWITDLIKEVATPKRPAFDFKEYVDAELKYGKKTADQMKKSGEFNLDKKNK